MNYKKFLLPAAVMLALGSAIAAHESDEALKALASTVHTAFVQASKAPAVAITKTATAADPAVRNQTIAQVLSAHTAATPAEGLSK